MAAKRQSSKVRVRELRVFGYIITVAKVQPVAKPRPRKNRNATRPAAVVEAKAEIKPTTLLDQFPEQMKSEAQA